MRISNVLGVIFVTLELFGVINWSWWLVLFSFYITFAVIELTLQEF